MLETPFRLVAYRRIAIAHFYNEIFHSAIGVVILTLKYIRLNN